MLDSGPHQLWTMQEAPWQYHVAYMAYWYDCAPLPDSSTHSPEEINAWVGGHGFALLSYRDGTFALVDIEHKGNRAVLGSFDHTYRLTLDRVKALMAGAPITPLDWGLEEGSSLPSAATGENIRAIYDSLEMMYLPCPSAPEAARLVKELEYDADLRRAYVTKIIPLFKAQKGSEPYPPSSADIAPAPLQGPKNMFNP